MGKTRVIAETGAGQHGVATALASALFGFKCRIYMGAKDVERQKPNVFRMELMGAEVVPVTAGSGTLKEACNAALRNWAESFEDTHYMLGTAAGPHPFPTIVREFQKVIGEEARAQWEEMTVEEHMEYYEKQGISRKDAMKMVAKDRGVGKRDIYKALL